MLNVVQVKAHLLNSVQVVAGGVGLAHLGEQHGSDQPAEAEQQVCHTQEEQGMHLGNRSKVS